MSSARPGFIAVIRRFFESKFRKKSIVLRYDKRSKRKCCIFLLLLSFYIRFCIIYVLLQSRLPLTLPQTRFLPHKPLKKKLRRCQNRRSFSSRFFQIVIVALHLRRCCGGSPCRCLNLCRRSRGPPIDHQAVAGSYRLQTRHEYLIFLALHFPPTFVMIGGQ